MNQLYEQLEFQAVASALRESSIFEEPNRSLDRLSESGAKIIYPGHEDYPFDAEWAGEVPPFLSYWGTPVWKSSRTIAVVGTREPSKWVTDWMASELVSFLKATPCALVSGGARGCDQEAHFAAIRAGRPTVVWLPSGLAKPYPSQWMDWKDQVVAGGGAVISMFPPFQDIRREHFERRNRYITLMSRLLFVAQARRRSGSTMTARIAKETSRTICVLPSRPDDASAGGTVDLLFEGAFPIRDGRDLAALFGLTYA